MTTGDLGTKHCQLTVAKTLSNMAIHITKVMYLKNQDEVLFVTEINENYYPRQYRVTNNKSTTYSISDDELSKYELIFSEEGAK